MRGLTTIVTFAALACVVAVGVACKPAPPKAVEPGLPVLFSFETDEAVAAWKVEEEIADRVELSVSTEKATTGKRSLKMVLKPHAWPGMHTMKLPKDWSGYSELKFDVIAEQDANLCIRIDDEASTGNESRFNQSGLSVSKGTNTVTVQVIDVAEAIDTMKIKSMFIFTVASEFDFWTGDENSMTFYIDNIRLVEKKAD